MNLLLVIVFLKAHQCVAIQAMTVDIANVHVDYVALLFLLLLLLLLSSSC